MADYGSYVSDDSGAFPVFSPSGQMLGNLTSIQGQQPVSDPWGNSLAYLANGAPVNGPGSGPILSPNKNAANSMGGQFASGISGSVLSAPGSASIPNTTLSNPTANAAMPGTGSPASTLADYFARGVIIVLGLIFVAVGLNMFRKG